MDDEVVWITKNWKKLSEFQLSQMNGGKTTKQKFNMIEIVFMFVWNWSLP